MFRENMAIGDLPVCPRDKMEDFEKLYDGRFVPFYSEKKVIAIMLIIAGTILII